MAETTPRKTAAKATAAKPAGVLPPDEVWAALAQPFPEDQIEKLPKVLDRNDQRKGRCDGSPQFSADGHACGGWHSRAVHLDYVGHAGITTRLNDVLGPAGWDFAPYALTPEGLPLIARGEFWASLTIRVGDQVVTKSDLAANFNGSQEAYGDALRRCAMRFGIGTYLWSKSDAAKAKAQFSEDAAPEPQNRAQEAPPAQQAPQGPPPHVQVLLAELEALNEGAQATVRAEWVWPNVMDLTASQAAEVHALVERVVAAENAADPWAAPQDPQNAR